MFILHIKSINTDTLGNTPGLVAVKILRQFQCEPEGAELESMGNLDM